MPCFVLAVWPPPGAYGGAVYKDKSVGSEPIEPGRRGRSGDPHVLLLDIIGLRDGWWDTVRATGAGPVKYLFGYNGFRTSISNVVKQNRFNVISFYLRLIH